MSDRLLAESRGRDCLPHPVFEFWSSRPWSSHNPTGTSFITWFLLYLFVEFFISITSSARTSRGRKFQRKKTISQRKNLHIECAQGDRPARCPNHFFAVNEPSAVPWWWCDLFWCHEVACGVRWSNVLGCEVTWGELLWLVATWHVMLCHLMCCSCHLVRCDGHVMSLDVLQSTTPVLLWLPSSTPVLLYTTKYYSVLQSTTPVLLRTTKYYSSTTRYYKVRLRTTKYNSVLHSNTPVLLRTTKFYSSTTLYYKVLLRTTKYYSSTTPYYKVLLQYYSVLQSTTPVLLCNTNLLKYRTTLFTKYHSNITPYYKVLL